jgi:hypothetical protein
MKIVDSLLIFKFFSLSERCGEPSLFFWVPRKPAIRGQFKTAHQTPFRTVI